MSASVAAAEDAARERARDAVVLYGASPTKRARATKAEMAARHDAIRGIVLAMQPMRVRQAYYQAVVRDLMEKTETGYDKVQRALVAMRRSGALSYGCIVDNTRWQRKPRSFTSIEEALLDTAQIYRKSLWADANCYVEIWIEKGALAGVIFPITSMYDGEHAIWWQVDAAGLGSGLTG